MKNIGPRSTVAVAWGVVTTTKASRIPNNGEQDHERGEEMAAPELEDEIEMMVERRVQVNDAESLRPSGRGQRYGDSRVEAELWQSRDEGGEDKEDHSEQRPVRTDEADNQVVTEAERSLNERELKLSLILRPDEPA